MNCTTAEKWISDWLDGALKPDRKKILHAHLESCLGCRDYAEQIRFLGAEADRLYSDASRVLDAETFTAELRTKLFRLKKENHEKHSKHGKSGLSLPVRWRWAAAAASLFLMIGLQFLLQTNGPLEFRADLYTFSYENALSDISWELQGDEHLAEAFNSLILNSIEEELDSFEMYMENSLYPGDLSEEELKILEAELKKEVTS